MVKSTGTVFVRKSTVFIVAFLIGGLAAGWLVLVGLPSPAPAADNTVLNFATNADYSHAPFEVDHGAVPLSLRTGSAMVALQDNRVAIWGGNFEAANLGFPNLEDASLGDGVVYDPLNGSWEMMSNTDLLTASPVAPFGLAGDDRVFWFSGTQAASWDPATNTWAAMAPAPHPVVDAIWDGGRIVSLSAQAMFDPLEDEWLPLAGSLAALAEQQAQLIGEGRHLAAVVASGDAVSLHTRNTNGEWVFVSRVELGGSVYGFDVTSHEGSVYLVSATGMATRYNLDNAVWAAPQRLPLPVIPQFSQVRPTSIGPVWFGGGAAIRLNDPSLLPVPEPTGRSWAAVVGTEVWGIGHATTTQQVPALQLFNFDASNLLDPQFVGFDTFSLDISDLAVSIKQTPLSTVLPNQSAIKFNLRFPEGVCEITVTERVAITDQNPVQELAASLVCPNERLTRQTQSRVVGTELLQT